MPSDTPTWYVLRDLKRSNAKNPAYKVLPDLGFETFTPMRWTLKTTRDGAKERRYIPFITSLLFVKSLKPELDNVIDNTDTLQYRYVRGAQRKPMTVGAEEMERFIRAVTASQENCIYYAPEDITPDMLGKRVVIVGGPLDGTEGNLLTRRGSKKKRLVLQLKDMLVASIEIESGLIQFL